MNEDMLLQAFIGLMAITMTLIGFTVRSHKADHEKLKDSHAALALDVSRNYASKSDLNAARMESNDSLKRLHDRIDDLGNNVDRKMDAVIGMLKK